MDDETQITHPGALESVERRVLGVLVEKAKTTPDAYPLSLNALRTGCNQKNNRSPKMELDEERVESAIEACRQRGALTIVQGDSRVERYRHRLYEWLGLEKAELAVVAELLLRGAQTVGELRGRAARMEPIAGVAELMPILDELVQKGWIEFLGPRGRGAVVSHTFYSSGERERVCRDLGIGATGVGPSGGGAGVTETPDAAAAAQAGSSVAAPAPSAVADSVARQVEDLRAEVADLREELERLRQRVEG
ncbi:MAG: DUF480 domain-containing protein [Planctomycetota bacterium]